MQLDVTFEHAWESNRIEGFEDDSMAACTLGAWTYLKDAVFSEAGEMQLDELDLKICHQIVVARQRDPEWATSRQWRGSWRRCDLRIGRETFVPNVAVPSLMTDWIADFNDLWEETEPRDLHIRFEKIHPFEDGNGRTGRLLMWLHEWLLARRPTLISYGDREEYFRWFRAGDKTLLAAQSEDEQT